MLTSHLRKEPPRSVLITGEPGVGKTVWIIPRFHELYCAGRHQYSPIGILDLLLPMIESGKIAVAGEIQPAYFEKLAQYRPALRTAQSLLSARARTTGSG